MARNGFPKEIRVGNTRYCVLLEPHPEVEGQKVDGYCENQASKIVIRSGMSTPRRVCILMHEVVHASIAESGVSLESEVEETLAYTTFPMWLRALEDCGLIKMLKPR
jgi:hypothetical protein